MKHRARKRFGQNFLVDPGVIERAVAAIAPRHGDLIIEIGPGLGALTDPLLESGARLVAVEIDRDLAAGLHARRPGLEIRNQDALHTDFPALAQGHPYRLAGNLPYNISTPLLFHLLAQDPPPVDMHFMLQKEVARRLAAIPGDANYGRLTLTSRNRCTVTLLFEVGPLAFQPPPRVESAFVRLVPRAAPLVEPYLQASFERLVTRAFSQRRKTLRNSLRGLLTAEDITAAGVDPGVRPERLDLESFRRLARTL